MSRLFYHVMQDSVGNLLFDVMGTMRIAGTGTAATIYGDEALTVVLPNPMTNHPSFGSFKCFLGAGDYDFYMAKAGYTFETLTGLQGHGTMAEQDADAVAITGGTATFGPVEYPAHALVAFGPTRLGPVAPPNFALVVESDALVRGKLGVGNQPPGDNTLQVNGATLLGPVAAPAFALVVDADGLFRGKVGIGNIAPGTDTLRVTGNTSLGPVASPAFALVVDADGLFRGKVGIGNAPPGTNALRVNGPTLIGPVASPTHALVVEDDGLFRGKVGIGNAAVGPETLHVNGSTLLGPVASPNFALVVEHDGLFRGKLGVGNPAVGPETLHVNGSTLLGPVASPNFALVVDVDGLVRGKLGVGNATPGTNTLSVNGPTLLGPVAAPAFALVVEHDGMFRGKLGVGNVTPGTDTLSVNGATLLEGKVQVGIGTPVANYRMAINWAHTGDYGLIFRPNDGNDTGAGNPVQFCAAAGTPIGNIATNASSTSYNTVSDARLKHNVAPLTGALDVVRALKPITHRWRADDSPGVGLLAQEVQHVIPDGVITGERDAVDAEGQIVPQMIDYSKLVPWLVGAVKELTQQVETLTAQLAAARA